MGKLIKKAKKQMALKRALREQSLIQVSSEGLETLKKEVSESKLDKAIDFVKPFWKPAALILGLIKNFTVSHVDVTIDKVIVTGNAVFEEGSSLSTEDTKEFTISIAFVWGKAKPYLSLVKALTPSKVDIELDKIASILDALSGTETE